MTDETDPDDGTDVSLRQALAGEVVGDPSFFEHARVSIGTFNSGLSGRMASTCLNTDSERS